MNEEEIKSNNVNVRFPFDEIIGIKQSGMTISNFVRQAIREKLERDNPKFLKKRKKELQEEFERIEEQEKIFEQKKQESTYFTKTESQFLIESKELIEKNPNFLDGRINKFINDFGKPYKISRKDFYKLMDESETQSQEKEILQEAVQ